MKHPGKDLKHYAEKAEVPPIKAHGKRDCAIGNLKPAGVSDWLIARIAGCTIDNLKQYGHLDVDDVRLAVQKLNVDL